MKLFIASLIIYSASLSWADTATFNIDGMTCGNCVKHVKKGVCDKMSGLNKCEVDVGSLKIETPSGVKIDTKKVEELVTTSGKYKVISSDLGPAEVQK